jgi:hypothetical protein
VYACVYVREGCCCRGAQAAGGHVCGAESVFFLLHLMHEAARTHPCRPCRILPPRPSCVYVCMCRPRPLSTWRGCAGRPRLRVWTMCGCLCVCVRVRACECAGRPRLRVDGLGGLRVCVRACVWTRASRACAARRMCVCVCRCRCRAPTWHRASALSDAEHPVAVGSHRHSTGTPPSSGRRRWWWPTRAAAVRGCSRGVLQGSRTHGGCAAAAPCWHAHAGVLWVCAAGALAQAKHPVQAAAAAISTRCWHARPGGAMRLLLRAHGHACCGCALAEAEHPVHAAVLPSRGSSRCPTAAHRLHGLK